MVVAAIEYASVWSVRMDDNPKSVIQALLKPLTRMFICESVVLGVTLRAIGNREYPFNITVDQVFAVQVFQARNNVVNLGCWISEISHR